MICPKCRNNVTGNWCVYCGTKLEESVSAQADAPFDPMNPTSAPYGAETAEDMYRDDTYSGTPGEEYYSPEDSVNPYGDYYDQTPPDNNKSKIIAIVSICVACLIVVGFLLFKFVFSKDGNKDTDIPSKKPVPVQSDADNKVKSLTQKGENYMRIGDYEKAEEIYLELSELTDDDEVNTVYDILYNYNRAIQKLDNGDYKAAEKFYNKIPMEYVDYDISLDVDNLYDDIKAAKNASKELEQIREYIDDEDYDSAREAIDTIDDTYLSSSDKDELEELAEELEEIEKRLKEEEEAKKREEEENKPSGYGHLSKSDAENFIYNYCYFMVEAINYNNFNLVSSYIHSSSSLYSQQKDLVASCHSQGITEQLDSLTLNNLTKINDSKWEAKVTEKETIFYSDESHQSKTFNWTYTIEYIGGQFYITGLR